MGIFNDHFESRTNKEVHSFIPTASALGFINPDFDWSDPMDRDLVCSGEIPFDSYFGPKENEQHTSFTESSVNWLLEELAGNPQLPPLYLTDTDFNGPDRICIGETRSFSFKDCQLRGIPNWHVTGNLEIISSNSTTVWVRPSIPSFDGWATVSVNTPTQVFRKRVFIGTPVVETVTKVDINEIPHISLDSGINNCEVGLRLDFTPNNNDVTDIEWQKITTDVAWSRDYYDYDDRYVFIYPTCNKKFKFRVRSYSDCGGWTEWQNLEYDITECTGSCPTPFNGIVSDNFVLYPVPANDVININLVSNPSWDFPCLEPSGGIGSDEIIDSGDGGSSNLPCTNPRLRLNISFYNNVGTLVYSITTIGIPTQVNVSNLTTGTYVMLIEYNGQVESHNINVN